MRRVSLDTQSNPSRPVRRTEQLFLHRYLQLRQAEQVGTSLAPAPLVVSQFFAHDPTYHRDSSRYFCLTLVEGLQAFQNLANTTLPSSTSPWHLHTAYKPSNRTPQTHASASAQYQSSTSTTLTIFLKDARETGKLTPPLERLSGKTERRETKLHASDLLIKLYSRSLISAPFNACPPVAE
jgi:hypothetical protein